MRSAPRSPRPPYLHSCLLLLGLLGSCSSPPKPPMVDASTRRPANTALAVDLQVCQNDLRNTRLLAAESGRLAETATATVSATFERLAARQQAAATAPNLPQANTVFTVHFDFGSTRVSVPADVASALVAEARSAPLIFLRGRTDSTNDAPVESRIARERAAAVRDYLVGAGVDPARIRSTFQPVGDHIADNTDPTGRGLNRRVEIELYRALPKAPGTTAVPVSPAP